MADAIFFHGGPNSKPLPDQQPVRIGDITDGTSNTLFFGETEPLGPERQHLCLARLGPTRSDRVAFIA
jgi:hypothetical protein